MAKGQDRMNHLNLKSEEFVNELITRLDEIGEHFPVYMHLYLYQRTGIVSEESLLVLGSHHSCYPPYHETTERAGATSVSVAVDIVVGL